MDFPINFSKNLSNKCHGSHLKFQPHSVPHDRSHAQFCLNHNYYILVSILFDVISFLKPFFFKKKKKKKILKKSIFPVFHMDRRSPIQVLTPTYVAIQLFQPLHHRYRFWHWSIWKCYIHPFSLQIGKKSVLRLTCRPKVTVDVKHLTTTTPVSKAK